MAFRDWNNNGDKNDWYDNQMEYQMFLKYKKNMDKKEKNKLERNYKYKNLFWNEILPVLVMLIIGVIYAGYKSLDKDIRFIIMINVICTPIVVILGCVMIGVIIKNNNIKKALRIIFSIMIIVLFFLLSLYPIDI